MRDEDDYDEGESRLYAIKKRKFLIEKKLNDYDPSSYEVAEEQTLLLPHKTHKASRDRAVALSMITVHQR